MSLSGRRDTIVICTMPNALVVGWPVEPIPGWSEPNGAASDFGYQEVV